eukprot:GHVL01036659.1.p1 GENE.GHVL01036659.1~~GHVL01036659.1.p1  ORF type:complete len:231 (+),score=54.38 GHVL01036659.1:240-932(+)
MFERPTFKKNCYCSIEDYECEFGFKRSLGSLECQPEENLSAPTCASGNFFLLDAYRKVPGDTCEGGWVPSKAAVPCPPSSPFSRAAITVLFVVLCLVLALGGVTVVSRSPELHAMIKTYASGLTSFQNVKYRPVTRDPEMGEKYEFIDEDDNVDDAPRLVNFVDGGYDRNAHEEIDDDEEDEIEEALAKRSAVSAATEEVPKLAAPPTASNTFKGNDPTSSSSSGGDGLL